MQPRFTSRRRPGVMTANGRKHRPDYKLPLLSIALLGIGLVVVYAIGPSLAAQKDVGENYYAGKQVISILLGIIAFAITANVPVSWWRQLTKALIVAAALASIAVRVFGEEINGAYRWIQIGGVSFQAAELIKFALLIWLAGLLTERIKDGKLTDYHKSFKPLLIALAVIGAVVVWLQSDLGSAAVMFAMMAVMLFVAGLPMKQILAFGGIVLVAVMLFIASTPYRRDRVATFLNPTQDCLSAGYQSCQALIAVGSGGMFGKGLGHSVQATGYLPEAANDSIFAIYAEKFGFLGVAVLLGLFVALFVRLFRIAERAPDDYARLLMMGIIAWLAAQSIINIGAMIGILPLKGITLPFVSYGGTSLLFVTGVMGVAFQISRYTTFVTAANTNSNEAGRHANNRTDRRRIRGAYHPGLSGRG